MKRKNRDSIWDVDDGLSRKHSMHLCLPSITMVVVTCGREVFDFAKRGELKLPRTSVREVVGSGSSSSSKKA